MRLYDTYGRLVLSYNMDFDLLDTRYWRKDTSDVASGTLYTFNISGATFRIKDGKAQLKDLATGEWHDIELITEAGTRYLSTGDTGEP